MTKLIVVSLFLTSAIGPAYAQSNPKREACLEEAKSKGLYSTGGRNGGFNERMAPQRAAFMKECMTRR